MPLNKIQLRAKIFEFLEPVRNLSAIDNLTVVDTLNKIKSIEDADFEFISKLLIKEADEKYPKSASAFLYIADKIAPESFMNFIFSELNSSKVKDEKKMFLMNIMAGLGVNFMPEDLNRYFINPNEVIEKETKKFIEAAKIEPDPVIDFLDFYFSTSKDEKTMMLDSVTADFEGDGLINLLSSLMLSSDDENDILYCLEIFEKSNSPLLLKPLFYLSKKNISSVQKKALKLYRKLKMKGVTNESALDLYKKLLSDFNAPKFQITYPDGNSNFSIVVSRKTKDDAYYLLFVAMNLEFGPFSSFGFSKITENDYNSIVGRFFNRGEQIFIDKKEGKKILDELTMRRVSLNKTVPYEYFAWEKLTEDIKPDESKLEDIFKKGLEKIRIGGSEKDKIYENKFIQNWFFKPSKNIPPYLSFIEKVEKLQKDRLFEMEILLDNIIKEPLIQSIIKKRLLYFAYCLKERGNNGLANIFYSLIYDKKTFIEFLREILKNSVYEHFLNLREIALKTKGFLIYDNKSAQIFIDYIEENWVK